MAGRATVGRLALCAALAGAACGGTGDSLPDATAAPDARMPEIGVPVELAVLDGHNHNAETSIAAIGSTVVVVSINQALPSADSFEYPDPAGDFRTVAVYSSSDGGASFEPPEALWPGTEDTSDPVVRAAGERFWISTYVEYSSAQSWIGPGLSGEWTATGPLLPVWDKEWLVPAPDGERAFIMGYGGAFLLAADGSVEAAAIFDTTGSERDRNAVAGYLGSDGAAHFLTMEPNVIAWAGVNRPVSEWPLPPFDEEHARNATRSAGALGEQADGTRWIVRSTRSAQGAPILLHVRRPGMLDEQIVELTSPTGVAFLPTAALDATGRLHAAWYDTTGEQGRLVYTHTVSDDLLGEWLPAMVVDPEACPGSRWYPYPSSDPIRPPGGRRLREYVDMAVVGDQVLITWTHAPEPPSRVRVGTIALPET